MTEFDSVTTLPRRMAASRCDRDEFRRLYPKLSHNRRLLLDTPEGQARELSRWAHKDGFARLQRGANGFQAFLQVGQVLED